jgi:hypothetical protein
MPIMRRPQYGGARASAEEETASSEENASLESEHSGAYRVAPQQRTTTKMWAQRPPMYPATLPSMSAVTPMRTEVATPSGGQDATPHATAPVHPASDERKRAHSDSGPRGTRTLKMQAVRPVQAPPPSSGRMLDDLDFLTHSRPPMMLELAASPAGHATLETIAGGKLPQSVRFTPQPMEAVQPPPSEPASGRKSPPSSRTKVESAGAASGREAPTSASRTQAFDPRPGIVAFAGFGLPPEKLAEMPAYALRVRARKRTLRAGLRVARKQRPQDVELYEAALASADQGAVAKGLALIVAVLVGGLSLIVAAVLLLLF